MSEEPRSVIVDSAECWTRSSLSLALFHARKFKEPLHKLLAIGRSLWALPELYFKAEVMQAVRDVPRGYCPVCGVGFVDYINCESQRCDWTNDPERSPSFTVNHPNVSLSAGKSKPEPQPPRPVRRPCFYSTAERPFVVGDRYTVIETYEGFTYTYWRVKCLASMHGPIVDTAIRDEDTSMLPLATWVVAV